MDDSLVKRLVDISESMASKLAETQKKVDGLERNLNTQTDTLTKELRAEIAKLRASESKHSTELNALKSEVQDRLSKFETWLSSFETDVTRSVDKGVAKGTEKVRNDFEGFKKRVQDEFNEVAKETTATLKALTIKFDDLQSTTDRKDKEVTERLEKELAAGLTALTKKIDRALTVLDATIDERRAELSDSVQNALLEKTRTIDELAARLDSFENVVSLQEDGLQKYVSKEFKRASAELEEASKAHLENAVAKAKAAFDKEIESERMENARAAEEQKKQVEEANRKISSLNKKLGEQTDALERRIEETAKAGTDKIAQLEEQLTANMNARTLKESSFFKEINEALEALIKEFQAEKTALREGISGLVEGQLEEKQVFQRIDGKIEYLENLIDMQNKGFDEKLTREVSRAIVDHTVQVQKRFEGLEGQMQSLEAYTEAKSQEENKRINELSEALRKEMETSSGTLRTYIGSLDNKYNKRIDSLKSELQAQVSELGDSASQATTEMAKEYRGALSELQKKVETLDNVLALQEEGERRLEQAVQEQLEKVKADYKSKLEQLRSNLEPMVNQRVESRVHALESKLDERYGNLQRTLKEQVKEVLVQDAEALATAKIENVLFALTEELERKKREVTAEVERIQNRAISSVDDVRRQIEGDIARVHSDIEANAQRLRQELEEVQSLKARIAADMERTGTVDLSEIMARLVRLENELTALKRSGALIRQPIILE